MTTNWIPTDRVRGGYEPAESIRNREYSDLSSLNPTMVTPGSYADPISAVVPGATSLRAAPEQLDAVQLTPTPPPEFQTLSNGTFNNGVVDVSIIPYMRRLDVDFLAIGMRPNRRVYFFFDDADVTNYISLSNSIVLNGNPPPSISSSPPSISDIDDDISATGDQIIANTSPGWTVSGNPGDAWRRRESLGRKRMQVRRRSVNSDGKVQLNITGGMDAIPDYSIIRAVTKNKLFQVEHNEVRTGKMNPNYWFWTSANTGDTSIINSSIILDTAFGHLPDNWWGTDGSNTAFLLNQHNHPLRGRKKFRIRGWNKATRRLIVDSDPSEDVPGFYRNPFLANDDSKLLANDTGEDVADGLIAILPTDQALNLAESDPIPTTAKAYIKTDSSGVIAGTFHMPGGLFFTGQKVFRVIDNVNNEVSDDSTTTYAEYKFVAQGLHVIVQEVNINVIIKPDPPPPPPPPDPPDEPDRVGDPGTPDKGGKKLPGPRPDSCCFIPSALVTMADGSKKPICEIQIGDYVLSSDKETNSQVTDVIVTKLGDRELYGIAGRDPFATEDHPFLTDKGWSAYVIGEYHNHLVKDNVEFINWDPMTPEEQVCHIDGYIPVGKINTREDDPDLLVYALSLNDDGDHTYWVEDLLTHNKQDPLAQSFWVEKANYPQGMFLSSIDLFFANKDASQPVSIEIRPTVNGYPDSNLVVPGSKVTVPADEVKISATPSINDPNTITKFKFSDPLYLPPGEYALVVYSPSVSYEVFLSELGEKVLGTSNIVSEQPYIGSIFKSQNATTWDASQLEDLMFVINKCRFTSEGRAVMYSSSAVQEAAPYGLFPIPVDELMLHTEQAILPGTTMAYELSSEFSEVYSEVQSGVVLIPDSGRIYYPANSDDPTEQEGFFKLAFNMSTENPDISPVVWTERFGAVMLENQIDNAAPTPMDFKIVSSGSGYPVNSELKLTFSGSGNGDAEIYAVSNSTGHIVDLVFDSYGSGFTEKATVGITSGSGSGASITMTSETDPQGGPAWCKYISRTVTLNQGFESSDLRAYVTAYKPRGTGVYVYYKVRNNNDPEEFAKKPWVKMIETEGLVQYSRNSNDYLEFEFTPFGEDEPFESISYTSGGATYNTFDQFAIKIVLTSDDTTYFPVLRDLRAIALPAAEEL